MSSPVIVYGVFWLALVPVAIANGILRERTYGRRMSELRAHQLSTLAGMLLTGLAVWLLALFVPLSDPADRLRIGLLWVVLTVAFGFGFGHWVAGHTWARLLRGYDLLAGRVWLVFLVWIGVLPYLANWLGVAPV